MIDRRLFGPEQPSSLYCTNGHYCGVVNPRNPTSGPGFCPVCGAQTINRCPNCQTLFENAMPSISGPTVPPSFCNGCGHGLPWQLSQSPF